MISYELPMGMAIASCILFVGSLSMIDVVNSQVYWWNIFRNPVGAVIFIVAAFAEARRTPFDIVEAEQESVGGFHTEYSSMKFGMFFLAEYMHVLIGSMLITTFFFGGYHLPFAGYWLPEMGTTDKAILDIAVFTIKTVAWDFSYIWLCWTIIRFKYSKILRHGCRNMIQICILNIS